MEPQGIHELTAAYALNALDPEEEGEFEEHLRRCPRCRAELAELQEAAAALAFGTDSFEPASSLRERILEQAAAERPNVVPLPTGHRRVVIALGAVAAVAAVVAIVLGIWASSLAGDLSDQEQLAVEQAQVIDLLAEQVAQVGLEGLDGTLIVNGGGEGALVLSNVGAAPAGKTYQAWVVVDGEPRPAGVFEGGDPTSIVRLTERVPAGAIVAVTVEDDGGEPAPTSEPIAATPTLD